ncbi:hypothetical protein FB561_0514 [Kribbella amoyensis]|uniref:Uncharacterized protein n=2 Tax=Kribbella amoyensis TaxID=996641 RepID=A0A561BKP5_9ACTN|nr:hypothetical protein FB561_0514 [Kribbella amoyensis]
MWDVLTALKAASVQTTRCNYNVAPGIDIRVMGRTVHDEYLRNFWHLRDTCRANGGVIT